MSAQGFHRWMLSRMPATYIPDGDPAVEMYDGTVRIFDQRGESMSMRRPPSRQLRALALQLEMCADELDRRSFEP